MRAITGSTRLSVALLVVALASSAPKEHIPLTTGKLHAHQLQKGRTSTSISKAPTALLPPLRRGQTHDVRHDQRHRAGAASKKNVYFETL